MAIGPLVAATPAMPRLKQERAPQPPRSGKSALTARGSRPVATKALTNVAGHLSFCWGMPRRPEAIMNRHCGRRAGQGIAIFATLSGMQYPGDATAQAQARVVTEPAPAPRSAAVVAAPVSASPRTLLGQLPPGPPGRAASRTSAAPAISVPVVKAAQPRIRVPANVLTLGDSSTVTVAGKQTSVGAIRRDIKAQILRVAGPAALVSVASHKVSTQTRLAAAIPGRNQNEVLSTIVDCTQEAPKILKIDGSIASGQQFTLLGNCFGEQTGDVKIIGQFAGGNMHVTFAQWTTGRIVAALPAVSGAPDQTVAVSVINREKVESTAKQSTFIAARERVEVPGRLWTPTAHFEYLFNNADSGTYVNAGATSPTRFDVTINPACALDNMSVRTTVGKVTAIDGWEDGPPNASTVQIHWEPQETQTTYTFSVVSDILVSSIFDVKAWANCPVGIAP
jgi:hypothetical protein